MIKIRYIVINLDDERIVFDSLYREEVVDFIGEVLIYSAESTIERILREENPNLMEMYINRGDGRYYPHLAAKMAQKARWRNRKWIKLSEGRLRKSTELSMSVITIKGRFQIIKEHEE